VSGDIVQVPAGIAATALALLQRDKKTSVFARCSAPERASTLHLAPCAAQDARITSYTARRRSDACDTFSTARKCR